MDVRQTPEEKFRSSLTDAAVLLRKLAPLANGSQDTNDLADMIELARTNDAQLRLLMAVVSKP